MNLVNFEIERIYVGWFEVCCRSYAKEVYFRASDAWENDAPKFFLLMLSELLRSDEISKYVVFDEEPGTYIVCIEKYKECKMQVLYSKFSDDEWGNIELYGNLSKEELEKKISISDELFEENIDLNHFVKTVLRSFEEYEKGQKLQEYEENWMKFPDKELKLLRSLGKVN